MNNSATAIRTALDTTLKTLVPGTLKQVAIGRDIEPTGFPFCRVFLVAPNQELKDNSPTYYRTYQYGVQIFQEASAKTPGLAEANFQDTIDAVMDTLGSGWTLSGNVDVMGIDSGTITFEQLHIGPVLTVTLLVSCRTLIS